MKSLGVIAALLAGGGLLFLASYLSISQPIPVSQVMVDETLNDGIDPPVDRTAPLPKAQFKQTELMFPPMELGEERKHEFLVTNTGEDNLLLKKGRTTCQCTMSTLNEEPIPPGKSATITLTWKPTEITDMFEKGATIYTNDAENRTVQLTLRGVVTERILLKPVSQWTVPSIKSDAPTEYRGQIVSTTLEKFNVTEIVSPDPLIKAEAIAMTPEQLNLANARCGYEILVTLQPVSKVGQFEVPLKIVTDAPVRAADGTIDQKTTVIKSVNVGGNRTGPFRIVDARWDETLHYAVMGQFPAVEGRTIEMRMIVKDVPEEGLEFKPLKLDPEFLTVDIKPVGTPREGSTSRSYLISVTVPPGSPAAVRVHDDTARVTLETSHPFAKQFTFDLAYTSY